MVRAQNRTIELEKLLAKFGEWEQEATEELKEKIEAVAWLETEVAELKKNKALAKKKAVEEYKSLDDFRRLWSSWLPNTSMRASTSAKGS
ncbi:hypothetical protein Acr_00g0061690 [Actinidia rufa]|uniref:Uncharacterized protein n=1 Tax=Actinidia rufa TaxID=165716 RepID=A0A7J0DNR3_9ERIC|nr:hypothetical protein Acr_00g0061690 [Actinidia rufa]